MISLICGTCRLDVLGLAADDERRARLVDEDRVDLVDDGVVELALRRSRSAENFMLSRR